MKIYVQIKGGLGNQLFQAAAALSLSRPSMRAEICLDHTPLGTPGIGDKRKPELLTTNLCAQDATGDRTTKLMGSSSLSAKLARRLMRACEIKALPRIIDERDYPYPARARLPKDAIIYMAGHWQRWEIFWENIEEIRSIFTPRCSPTVCVERVLKSLQSGPSIAIHVRRGDYLKPEVASIHGHVGYEYYKQAISIASGLHPTARIYWFSDDPDWTKANMVQMFGGEVVQHDAVDAIWDLTLMSSCKAVICANSTFSWWAAALSGSTAIIPRDWLNSPINLRNDLRFPGSIEV